MLYLAYGSNLNMEQMEARCPGAEVYGVGSLQGFRLMYKGSKTGAYLTVEPEAGSSVPVGIWKVTKEHEKALDRYEGFPTFYYKRYANLRGSDGKMHKAMFYVMHEERRLAAPAEYYVRTCERGYDDFGFDHAALDGALDYTLYNMNW